MTGVEAFGRTGTLLRSQTVSEVARYWAGQTSLSSIICLSKY